MNSLGLNVDVCARLTLPSYVWLLTFSSVDKVDYTALLRLAEAKALQETCNQLRELMHHQSLRLAEKA